MSEVTNAVWAAQHNGCTHESAFGIISIHRTEATAQAAADAHKKAYKRACGRGYKIPDWTQWLVEKIEVKP